MASVSFDPSQNRDNRPAGKRRKRKRRKRKRVKRGRKGGTGETQEREREGVEEREVKVDDGSGRKMPRVNDVAFVFWNEKQTDGIGS